MPEPRGRTYGELDVLFERGVSARSFRGTVVGFGGEGEVRGERVENVSGSEEKGGATVVERG